MKAQYKLFPQSNLIREWDKLVKLSREHVVQLQEQWEAIHNENEETYRQIRAEKHAKIEEAVQYMKSLGIDVYKYSKKGIIPTKNGYQAWFKTNVRDVIDKQFPSYMGQKPTIHYGEYTIDGFKVSNNQSPTSLVQLYDKITFQLNQAKQKKDQWSKLLVKSIEYATKNNVDIADLDSDAVINVVDEHAKEVYREAFLPEGTEVYLKHECYDCSTYYVGSHRCSCGNRRISIIVEGDIIQGYHYYPEAN